MEPGALERLLVYDDRIDGAEVAEPFAALANPDLPRQLTATATSETDASSGGGSNEAQIVTRLPRAGGLEPVGDGPAMKPSQSVRAAGRRLDGPRAPVSRKRQVLAEAFTPEGVRVVLHADTWHEHVLNPEGGHGELAPHLEAVRAAVTGPDHREPDPRAGRERFYKRDVGPSHWLMVVVSFEQEPARIVTALGYGHGRSPRGWMP